MEQCEVCGKQAKNVSGLKAHIRFKHAPPVGDPSEGAPIGGVSDSAGLKKYNLPRGQAPLRGIRVLKMAMPDCDICTDGIHAKDWYLTCPHNPYFHPQMMPEIVETREEQPDGTYIVTDRKTVQRVRDVPNIREVPVSPRHMGAQYNKKRAKGWRHMAEVGVSEFCQFSGCWSQDIPPQWRSQEYNGNYCSRDHALIALGQERGVRFEVGTTPKSREKREDQMASLTFR